MSDALGLSVGATNLVAAGVGRPPVVRRSVLTVYGHTAPDVGLPSRRGDGVTLSGFVERVGDPVPLVGDDGTRYLADQLVVEALEAMAARAGSASPIDVSIAVPSYWGPGQVDALRAALTASGPLAPGGPPPRLIPDAVAALTAMVADPGLERRGVLAVLDIGGSGTSISLAAAGSLELIGRTERFAEFAGDQIDQALLTHVLERVPHSADDTGATAAVGSLARLREQCRDAKEALSVQTEARIDVDVPGYRGEIVVTRADLESLLARPLDDVVEALRDTLQRNDSGASSVSAIVLVGGGSAIPAVRQRFSAYPGRVLWSPRPALDAAAGAALFAAFGGAAETATRAAPAAAPVGVDAGADGTSESTYALAWSQDDPSNDDVAPYAGADDYVVDDYDDGATGRAEQPNPYRLGDAQDQRVDDEPTGWRRLPLSLLGVVAAVALVAVGGVAIALTSVERSDPDKPKPGTAPLSRELTPTSAAGQTVTVPGQPAAPPTSAAPPPAPVVTTTAPVPTTTVPTTTVPTTTTTTTTTPSTTTTTTTTTTTVPTTTTTTTAPTTTVPTTTTAPTTTVPTTTRPPTTTTQAVTTTSYLTVPFVPVPIPIPVPAQP